MIEDCANHCCVIKSIFFHPNSSTPDLAKNLNVTRISSPGLPWLTSRPVSLRQLSSSSTRMSLHSRRFQEIMMLQCYDDSSFCMYQKWWLLLDDQFSSSCTLQDLTFLLGFYVSQIVKRWWVWKLWQWIILLKSSKVDQFLPKLNIDFNYIKTLIPRWSQFSSLPNPDSLALLCHGLVDFSTPDGLNWAKKLMRFGSDLC